MKILKYAYSSMMQSEKNAITREVEAMQSLDHPQVVKLIDYFVADDRVFIIS